VKVLKADPHRGHVDLSLKSVKDRQKSRVLEGYKQAQKARKLIELAAKNIKKEAEIDDIIKKLDDAYGNTFTALEETKKEDIKILEDAGLDKKWAQAIGKIVEDQFTLPKVKIKAVMKIEVKGPDAVDVIKNAMVKANETCKNRDLEAVFKYIGAPKYSVELTAYEYKMLEKCLIDIEKTLRKEIESNNGTVELIRK
jgi:translation initiation factor 2 subunit 1